MKTTEHLGLKKPEPADFYNVQDFNDNADIIDKEFATLISDETITAFAAAGIDITGE